MATDMKTPAMLTWTSRTPTTPGLYWYRPQPGEFDAGDGRFPLLVHVPAVSPGRALVAWEIDLQSEEDVIKARDPGSYVTELRGAWVGPLEPPDDPADV